MKNRLMIFLLLIMSSFILSSCFSFVGEPIEYEYKNYPRFVNAMNNLYDSNIVTYNYYLLTSQSDRYYLSSIKISGYEKLIDDVHNYSTSPTMVISYLVMTYTRADYTYEVHYEIVDNPVNIDDIHNSTYVPSKFDTELLSSVYYDKTCLIDYVYVTKQDESVDLTELRNEREEFIRHYLANCEFLTFTSK